jgi:hypothetical protein
VTERVNWSLAYFRAKGDKISVFCPNGHGRQIDIDAAIERFGPDFLIVPNRAKFLRAFRCTTCNQVASELIMTPGNTGPG